jgi:hypothetical protein
VITNWNFKYVEILQVSIFTWLLPNKQRMVTWRCSKHEVVWGPAVVVCHSKHGNKRSASDANHFTPGKKAPIPPSRYPLHRWLDGTQIWCRRMEKETIPRLCRDLNHKFSVTWPLYWLRYCSSEDNRTRNVWSSFTPISITDTKCSTIA